MYQRILIATGGSPWSEAALSYAIALAAQSRNPLRILTVFTVPAISIMPDNVGDSGVVMEMMEEEGEALLAQAVARAAQAGVACETIRAWGNVPETVLRVADEGGCDLIVMGSRGGSGWKRLMLGSITNTVAAKASQPVLVVKKPPPLASGARLWRRILVATGGSPWSEAAVQHAIQLARSAESELCVLHVDQGRPQRGEDPAASEGKQLLTRAEVQAAMAGIAYEGILARGEISRLIVKTAAEKQCDAVVMGSRGLTGWKRLMLGSISNEVATKAPCPVLLVKHFFDG